MSLERGAALVCVGGAALVLCVGAPGCGDDWSRRGPDETAPTRSVDLDGYMSRLQYHSHKLGRAIQHRNRSLAGYYLGECRETSNRMIQEVPRFNGTPVADYARSTLLPELRGLEEALQSDDWPSVRQQYRTLLEACNNCHVSSGRGSIRVTEPSGPSPFNQRFGPSDSS